MRAALVVTVLLIVAVPAPAHAWGSEAHKFIMDRAIALLPPELRSMFEANRAMVVERSIDPDTWRTAGFGEEPPNHFLDIDWEGYGKYPFAGLPRNYDEAVAKFGKDRVTQNGTLPWRAEELYGNLRRTFEAYGRGNGYGEFDTGCRSPVAKRSYRNGCDRAECSPPSTRAISRPTAIIL